MNSPALAILKAWRSGSPPAPGDWQTLLTAELADPQRARAFEIGPENGRQALAARAQLFREVSSEVEQLCQSLELDAGSARLKCLWELWLPLAMQLAGRRKTLGRVLVQGILGAQGTGKTTLAAATQLILRHLGLAAIGLSIDDLYKTLAERQQLQRADPRLLWRGPPGTHDVRLGIQLLDRLRQPDGQGPFLIPRFDKSLHQGAGDRTEPERVEAVDVVLFEGWLVGVRPVEDRAFDHPPPPIVTPEDRQFARDMNQRLHHYLPLWERLDRLIVLHPVDYRLSKRWRWEAEQKMMAAGKSGMDKEEIDRFVEYFWRSLHPDLFVAPLIQDPGGADLAIEIGPDHSPRRIYQT